MPLSATKKNVSGSKTRHSVPPAQLIRSRASFLTKHIQADFLSFLSRLVPGDAGVIAFIHLGDVFYDQFGAVLVEAVLVARFKDNVVTVARGRRRKDKCPGDVFLLEEPTDAFLSSLTENSWGLIY